MLMLASDVLDLLGDGDPDASATDGDAVTDDPDDLEQLLETSIGPVETPRDPALLRLLPDGYRNDDDAAGEFRRLTEASLRTAKRAALERLVEDLTTSQEVPKQGAVRVDLDEAGAEAWLPAITDLRLVFGTRIGVTEEMDEERAIVVEGSTREAEIVAYDWLSWWQEALVGALIGN